MRLRQLSYLEAALRHGSFRKAAEEQGIAQPSLSEQIRRLEEELGVVLLVRSRTGVTGTDAARKILPHVESILRLERTIREEAAAVTGLHSGEIRIGLVPSASAGAYSAAVRQFRRSHPRVDVAAREQGSDAIGELVAAGKLDLGIVLRTLDSSFGRQLRTTDLMPGRLAVCVPEHHPLAERSEVEIADIAGEPIVVHQKGFALRRAFERLRADRALTVASVAESHFMVQRLVSEGVGISLAFEPDIGRVPGGPVRQVPLAGEWARGAVAALQRADELPTPATNAFLRILRAEAQRLTAHR